MLILDIPTTTTLPLDFDLVAFGRAMEDRDFNFLVASYADDAEIRLTDPDTRPLTPRILRGRQAITQWLREECSADITHRMVRLVNGLDRVAYTEERLHLDGTHEVAASTAELENGVISLQHTVLVWDRWD